MSDSSTLNNQSLITDIATSVPSPQKEIKEIVITRDRFETFLDKKIKKISNISEINQTNIPKILDLQNLTAHYLLKAAKALSSQCMKGTNPMQSIAKEYETLLNKVEKIIQLKGTAVTIINDITALIDALQAVSNDTALSASELGNQASDLALNTTAASNEESQTNPVSSSLSQEKNAEQFQSTLNSFHTTLGSVSNYIETIAGHFNTIIQRAENPTLDTRANSPEHTYFNALFKNEAKSFLAPDAFKNFIPATKEEIGSTNRQVTTTAKQRLEFVYQIASDAFAAESSKKPLNGMIGSTKTNESILTTSLSSPTSSLQSRISDHTTENNLLPLQHYFFFTKTQENENGQWTSASGNSSGSNNDVNALLKRTDYGAVSQLVIGTYIAMRASLQSNKSTRELGAICMPLFIPPVAKSLANTEILLRTAQNNAMQALENAGQKVFTTEASADAQNRKTIKKAVTLITEALSEAATKLDNVAMQRDSLQRKTETLESEKDELNKTLHELNTTLNTTRLNLTTDDHNLSMDFNQSFNRSLDTSRETHPNQLALLTKTPQKISKNILKHMTQPAITQLNAIVFALASPTIQDSTIDFVLSNQINPLIAGIFMPVIKSKFTDVNASKNLDAWENLYGHKESHNRNLKLYASILLRLLCPEDNFASVIAKLSDSDHGGQKTQVQMGSSNKALITEDYLQGLSPRPDMKVMKHDGYKFMLCALFTQSDAKAKKTKESSDIVIKDNVSDYLLKTVLPQPSNELASSKKPLTPSIEAQPQNTIKTKVQFGANTGTPQKLFSPNPKADRQNEIKSSVNAAPASSLTHP